MSTTKNKKIIIIMWLGLLFIASVLMMRNTAAKNLAAFNYEQESRLSGTEESMAGARDEVASEANLDSVNDSEKYSNVKKEVANNNFFKVRIGTYWIYEGGGIKLDENNRNYEYKIKIKNEVVSISGENDNYSILTKTTDLINGSVMDGEIILGKDYLSVKGSGFNGNVRFPLKVGNRWSDDSLGLDDSGKLRDDLLYQSIVNWKLERNVLGNECYNVIEEILSDRFEVIWCNNLGELHSTYHHYGSLDDWRIRLVKYRY